MKKLSMLLIISFLCFTACSNKTNDSIEESSIVINETEIEVDVDLSMLSSTMIYAQIYNITMNAEDYIDKSIKIKGDFSYFYEESSGKTYYAIFVTDETACCSTGFEIEFLQQEEYLPENLPRNGEEVTIIGNFGVYDYYGITSCILKDAYFE